MRVLVPALWLLWLAESARQGWSLPEAAREVGDLPPWAAVVSVLLPTGLVAVVAIRAGPDPFHVGSWGPWIDARAGADAYRTFLVRLKPLLLVGAGPLVMSTVGIARGLAVGAPPDLYALVAFYVSFGLAMALVHVLLKRRGVPGF